MAPHINEADIEVLISCIKNSSTKLAPNFEKVAEECGLKDSKYASVTPFSPPSHLTFQNRADFLVRYMRHWRMMKKLGLTGERPQAQKPKQKADSVTTKKRGAAAMEEGEDYGGDGEDIKERAVPKVPIKKRKTN
jgi:hypothetical protein